MKIIKVDINQPLDIYYRSGLSRFSRNNERTIDIKFDNELNISLVGHFDQENKVLVTRFTSVEFNQSITYDCDEILNKIVAHFREVGAMLVFQDVEVFNDIFPKSKTSKNIAKIAKVFAETIELDNFDYKHIVSLINNVNEKGYVSMEDIRQMQSFTIPVFNYLSQILGLKELGICREIQEKKIDLKIFNKLLQISIRENLEKLFL